MSEKNDNDLGQQVQKTLRDLGVNSVDWDRRVSAGDVLYLLDQWPFLQIMKADSSFSVEDSQLASILPAPSGWQIHDYGDALSSSPGDQRFGPLTKKRRTQDKEEDEGGSGVGTLVNQAVITAFEMIKLAHARGWNTIELMDGHPLMAWAAWMQAMELEIEIKGFSPTAKDFAKWRRLKGQAFPPEPGLKPSR